MECIGHSPLNKAPQVFLFAASVCVSVCVCVCMCVCVCVYKLTIDVASNCYGVFIDALLIILDVYCVRTNFSCLLQHVSIQSLDQK